MNVEKDANAIHVVSHGGRDGSISISGFTKDELEWMITAFNNGGFYVRRNPQTGRLEKVNTLEDLPDPKVDEELYPHFSKEFYFGEGAVLRDLIFDKERRLDMASFIIHSVCGYGYTAENYKWQTAKLDSWGFICLRSRRDTGNRFWEVYYLPGIWAAKGDLKKAVAGIEDRKEQVQASVNFLCQHASFGSLDICTQRAAMEVDG